MKVYKLKKSELVSLCKSHDLETKNKTKAELLDEYQKYLIKEIQQAKNNNTDLNLLKKRINDLADEYAEALDEKIESRKEEMKNDDNAHYLIYRVLGVTNERGAKIDVYQNTGRFLYKYAGSFLEEASSLCFWFRYPKGKKSYVNNTSGKRPKKFEIDFLNGKDAIEIKWRDATTDGDHITKEHTRVKVISDHGYTPIRVMFYYPQRKQAQKIQETLKTLYTGIKGKYYSGDDAWKFIQKYTTYNLKEILKEIADIKCPKIS